MSGRGDGVDQPLGRVVVIGVDKHRGEGLGGRGEGMGCKRFRVLHP